jgi:hypothetical protein
LGIIKVLSFASTTFLVNSHVSKSITQFFSEFKQNDIALLFLYKNLAFLKIKRTTLFFIGERFSQKARIPVSKSNPSLFTQFSFTLLPDYCMLTALHVKQRQTAA